MFTGYKMNQNWSLITTECIVIKFRNPTFWLLYRTLDQSICYFTCLAYISILNSTKLICKLSGLKVSNCT